MGRNKIKIAKIKDTRSRQVTFTKRKNGLYKKLMELSVLCNAKIGLVMFNESGKLFRYCSNGDMEDMLKRYHETSSKAHESRQNADLYEQFYGGAAGHTRNASVSNESHEESCGTPQQLQVPEAIRQVPPVKAPQPPVEQTAPQQGQIPPPAPTFSPDLNHLLTSPSLDDAGAWPHLDTCFSSPDAEQSVAHVFRHLPNNASSNHPGSLASQIPLMQSRSTAAPLVPSNADLLHLEPTGSTGPLWPLEMYGRYDKYDADYRHILSPVKSFPGSQYPQLADQGLPAYPHASSLHDPISPLLPAAPSTLQTIPSFQSETALYSLPSLRSSVAHESSLRLHHAQYPPPGVARLG